MAEKKNTCVSLLLAAKTKPKELILYNAPINSDELTGGPSNQESSLLGVAGGDSVNLSP